MAVAAKIGEKYSFPRHNSSPNLAAKRSTLTVNFSDVQSDIVINVDGVTFSLHKFPLLSRSGRIRRLAAGMNEGSVEGMNGSSNGSSSSTVMLEFSNFPGGADAFELAAKFCYGINFEISTANVAQLRCAAEHLEMTEDYGDENLVARAESFLREVVFQSLEKSVEVLVHVASPQDAHVGLFSYAEEVKLVNRCIDAVACKAAEHALAAGSRGLLDCSSSGRSTTNQGLNDGLVGAGPPCRAVVEWWAEELAKLRVDLYQRVVAAMKSRGVRAESLGGSLMQYAQKNLRLGDHPKLQQAPGAKARGPSEPPASGHVSSAAEQRILVESLVSLLPPHRGILPTHFLLRLLRAAVQLDTTVACRLDLERRAGGQLEHATVDDLLIPAGHGGGGDTLFDVDVVQRVLAAYLQQYEAAVGGGHVSDGGGGGGHLSSCDSDGGPGLISPSQRGIMKVGKLVDAYLAEIAPDANLKVSKFLSVAELLPEHARLLDDGLYRAIDIFLKAHPSLSDLERKKMCKLLDCQKLSQEACTHAAQNERLPVQLVVQVLYFEQLRMRSAMATDETPLPGGRPPSGRAAPPNACASPKVDPYSNSLRRDNRELKLEVARLRLRVNDLEKENASLKQELLANKPPPVVVTTGSSGFFSFMSRRLGKMGLFASSRSPRESATKQPHHKSDNKAAPRRRRHSIS